MDKSWKKDAKRRVAEVIEDIIKMTSKEEIIMFVKNQSLDLDDQFRNPELIKQINND
jgi:HD superfamily phosphohydrolase YqeK